MTLEYAERMAIINQEVDDEFFSGLRRFFDEDALVEVAGTGRD